MLINMEIYEQRWTVRDVSLVPFTRSKQITNFAVGPPLERPAFGSTRILCSLCTRRILWAGTWR